LRAYLEEFGDVPAAAARLGVHPNTFRYRLRKALKMVDVSDPDRRLVVELQLRLLEDER
jgi:DNA-binding PucR family transcriptional regulator